MLNKNSFMKISFFLIGVLVSSFGIVLITKSNLGTSQISSISYVMSLKYSKLDFGMATFLLNVFFLLIQILILRNKFDKKILFQLPASFILGYFISTYMKFLSMLDPRNVYFEIFILLLGCIILALGISIEVAPDIVKIPGDGIVYVIAKETGIEFGKVKVIFDIILVTVAIIISILSFRQIQGIGIGTVISALLVGRFVNVFDKHLSGRYSKLLN